jgi:hypothetical protein
MLLIDRNEQLMVAGLNWTMKSLMSRAGRCSRNVSMLLRAVRVCGAGDAHDGLHDGHVAVVPLLIKAHGPGTLHGRQRKHIMI